MNERGGILVVLLVVVGMILLFVAVCVLLIVVFVSGTTVAPDGSTPPSATAPSDANISHLPASGKTSSVPPASEAEIDFGGAQLVCVRLPGVNYPRTPALDRRAVRRLIAAMQQMEAEGISGMTFTWGFRTTCQQENVDAGPNLKAKPGTSPHESGGAVDMNGMRVRPDRGRIVQIMQQHGFRWLGVRDPPHFDVMPSTVGEVTRGAWIRKAQELFRQGQPREGCRGTPCGS